MRERLAGLLYKAGALGAVMQLRRRIPVQALSIVTYHHIADEAPGYPFDPDVADATPVQFRRQLEALLRLGTPICMDELLAAVDGAPLPPNPIMVTFDDGYRSCLEVATPILREMGIRATFFIASSFITERRLYWWERIALLLSQSRRDRVTIQYPSTIDIERRDPKLRRRLLDMVKTTPSLDIERLLTELATALEIEWTPEIEARHADQLIMTWDQVRGLARAGMDVESHGRRHRVLRTLDPASLEDELAGSRVELEAELGRPVRAIAYPVGRSIAPFHHIRRAVAAAGYRVGLSNKTGVNPLWPAFLNGVAPSIDRFNVRRLATDREMSDAMFLTQIAVPALAYVDPEPTAEDAAIGGR